MPPSPTGANVAPRRKGFKIPLPVAIALVGVLAIVAGWFVYDQTFDQPRVDLRQYETNDSRTAQARRRFFEQAPPPPNAPANVGTGVVRRRDGFDARVVGARARFTIDANTKAMKLDAAFVDMGLFPQRDRNAARARYSVISNAGAAESAKVNAEQVETLRKISFPREMSLPDDARQQLLDIATRYNAAPDPEKPAIEKELTDRFRDASTKALQPTVEAYRVAADEVRKILDENQINALSRAN